MITTVATHVAFSVVIDMFLRCNLDNTSADCLGDDRPLEVVHHPNI